jgi:hypothetical protein
MIKTLLHLALLLYLPLEARLYFIHVPKTAGTTLRLMLEMQVAADEIYPYRHLTKAMEPVHHDLVSGHLFYELCKKLDPDFNNAFKVTTLREPVERYLSFLRAVKRRFPQYSDLESVLDEKLLPNSRFKFGLLNNAMCRFFADRREMEGVELLQSAKKNLESFDCVLFFDTFARDTVDLFERLGVVIEENAIPQMNAARQEPVSEELLEKVKQENLLDIELYAYAKAHLRKKQTEYQLRGQSYKEITIPKTSIEYTFDLPMYGKGWSYRDKRKKDPVSWPFYRWVMNEPATIYFPLKEKKDYHISFIARPFVSSDSIEMYVNGHKIVLLKSGMPPFFQYEGTIEKEWLTEGFTEVSFHPQEAILYNNIKKNLYLWTSFAIHRIQVH